jgi:hypothetical protein
VSAQDDDRPADHVEPAFDLVDEDDLEEGPAKVGSLLDALGQIVAAVIIVMVLIALFIGGAVVYRRIFG